MGSLDFGSALNALKAGKKIRRTGWNRKIYIALNVDSTHITIVDIKENIPWIIGQNDILANDWEIARL